MNEPLGQDKDLNTEKTKVEAQSADALSPENPEAEDFVSASSVRRRRRSERYLHAEDNTDQQTNSEDSAEGTSLKDGGSSSGETQERIREDARVRMQNAGETDYPREGRQSLSMGERGKTVNPLQDLANRATSLSAGGGSRAKVLKPSGMPAERRDPETWRKLERNGYPRATMTTSPQARDATMRVGYAPGRMEESEGILPPAQPATSGGREAPERPIRMKNYPENRYNVGQPRTENSGRSGQGKSSGGNGRKGLRNILLLLAAVIAVAAIVLVILPSDNGLKRSVLRLAGRQNESEATASPVPDPVYVFTVSGNENQIAPADVTFSVTTGKNVTAVRLTDEDGWEVAAGVTLGDNANDNAWMLTMHSEDGYDGNIRLQIREEEGEWLDTDYTAPVQVASRPAEFSATVSPMPAESGETQVGVVLQQESAGMHLPEEMPAEEEEADATDSETGETAVSEETNEIQESAGTEAEVTESEATEPESPATEAEVWEPAAETEVPETPTPEPTAEPTPEPTEEPTPTPALTATAVQEADPELISTAAIYNGSKKISEYSRPAKELIHMPAGGEYTRKNMGVLTFRGDAFRQNAAAGTVQEAKELAVAWQVEAGSARGASTTYYGIGWTGQPAIVKWSKEVREKSNLYETKLEKVGLKEVIIAGLDGMIYFLDLEDGSLTRNSIKLGYPMKGTPSVHPSGYPFMTVGQYARKMKSRTGSIGLRQYNLYTGKEMSLIDGFDGKLHRGFNEVGSFETSALIDRTSDTMITAASNGLLYLISLNSDFDYQAGTYRQSGASTVVLRSRTKAEKKDSQTAIESSIAMYDKYVFYADMGGVLRCVDTNSLKTVWAVETGDAVEAAVALNLNEAGGLDLFTGNMLINRSKGAAQLRGYDALSGAEKWVTEIPVKRDTKTKEEVGAKASPLVGQNQLQDLVYFTVTGISEEGKSQMRLAEDTQAALLALDQETGSIVWVRGLSARSESSPVAVYDETGRGWVIQASEDGEILLLDGLTGKVIHQLSVEGKIEASPAVYNDMLVIGTTGKDTSFIYGIRIQ